MSRSSWWSWNEFDDEIAGAEELCFHVTTSVGKKGNGVSWLCLFEFANMKQSTLPTENYYVRFQTSCSYGLALTGVQITI
jgi:hypothetical protein